MTEVGKMIYEEGMEKGVEQGIDKVKDIFVKSVIKALTKKLGMLPDELQKSILSLTVEQIEKLTEDVTDIGSIEDLKKYI